MISVVTILGETLPDRFVVAMLVILLLLALEIRAWLRKIKEENR